MTHRQAGALQCQAQMGGSHCASLAALAGSRVHWSARTLCASAPPLQLWMLTSHAVCCFVLCQEYDFPTCDLLLVMGTSLVVHPFASLIGEHGCVLLPTLLVAAGIDCRARPMALAFCHSMLSTSFLSCL